MASAAEPLPLINQAADDVALKPTSSQVSAKPEMTGTSMGIGIQFAAGDEQYPGLAIAPAQAAAWNLSQFGHVEAKVINTGQTPVTLSLRIDNPGDWKKSPWNTESCSIKPGESAVVKVIFGYAYGYKPSYKLDSGKISKLLLFTRKTSQPQSVLIESITAGGDAGETPLVDPKAARIVPPHGVMMGQGVDITNDLKVEAKDVTVTPAGSTITLDFAQGGEMRQVRIMPTAGKWDLRDAVFVRMRLKNAGDTPITPRARIESSGGSSDWVSALEPIGPGESGQLTIPFAGAAPWQGPDAPTERYFKGKNGTGSRLASDSVTAMALTVGQADHRQVLAVESITSGIQPASRPDWLGKRPPVEGDWQLTFEDNFDGDKIDLARWNIYTQNYWDKRTHFSKDNVIVADGLAKLHYEKKRGFHNDDPNQTLARTGHSESDYACGFLDTYGKWTQRYGYFEARIKLPTSPGLWPAFWLMPDRGADTGPQWKRTDTANGGMEFDIMEHLTRWGSNRHNIAFHWDGYQKNHKSASTSCIYAGPDEEGFLTCGLLWLPGEATYYYNGQVVAQWKNDRISSVQSYLIFNMVSGGWDNSALDDSQLPADYVIDYVRCWQRSDLKAAE